MLELSRSARALLAGALVLAGTSAVPAAHAQDCDRACLESHVDAYLSALVAHEPARLPLAEDVRFTENGQALGLDQALWATASGDTDFRLYFTDPLRGRAGLIGLVAEHGNPVFLALRLRIESGEITEIEHIAHRMGTSGFGNPENMTAPKRILTEIVPLGQRTPRADLIAAANSYFSGLDEENTGANVPFHPDCQRIENGRESAGATREGASSMQRRGCAEQFNLGFSTFITDIRERRYPVVDVERGLVYSIVFFDHAGDIDSVEMTNGETLTVGADYRQPRTWMIGELFKVVDGRIVQIEAVLVDVPYGMPSGWW